MDKLWTNFPAGGASRMVRASVSSLKSLHGALPRLQPTPDLQALQEHRSFNPAGMSEITERQLECLAWVAAGKSAPDIGVILGISGRTVDSHVARLCEHLGVRTRLQAVMKAQALGMIGPSGP